MIVFLLAYDTFVLITLLQETDFNDLGKLLLGGVAAAIVFAIGFTFVRMRLRDKRPHGSGFISINSDKDK